MQSEERLDEIMGEIQKLPIGNITYKTIRGKSRMYLQWRENGKNKSRYIKASWEESIRKAVEYRTQLEEEYQKIKKGDSLIIDSVPTNYKTNVIIGERLLAICRKVERYGKRECMDILKKYLDSDLFGKVCLIYGLRRTGKTTMILQAISELPNEGTAYIKIMSSNTMSELNEDLKKLYDQGCRYVFVDEVTLMSDFIDGASLLSDVYAMFGMKIVLSGTDSLGFAISLYEELYDRAVMIHTTFIPFREYSKLLGIPDIDEYIRYGGTFRVGETDFSNPELTKEGVSFRDDESTRRYIDTAIAKNIQHSLACYQEGGHFRHLINLYEKDELTNAINRVIEDMNHRFLVSIIESDFKSHDLGSSSQILRKKSALAGEVNPLDEVDISSITEGLARILDIKNTKQTKVKVTKDQLNEIKEYLFILDLIMPSPVETINTATPIDNYLFSQPGMRYCQAQALVYMLMKDETLKKYPAKKRKEIEDLILEEVRGRMLEEIVLLETIKKLPANKRAFKLKFAIGEYDMVVQDTENITCEIYEIKHADHVFEGQYKHLMDENKLSMTEHEFGTVTKKCVLYRGQQQRVGDIEYLNVEDYLCR